MKLRTWALALPFLLPVVTARAAGPDASVRTDVMVVENHAERALPPGAAGYTVVDLREEWTPYIFQEQTGADGALMAPRYRSVFLGLARDLGDPDGQALLPGQHNYLELFGIPPTLKVLRERFLADATNTCPDVDFAKLNAVTAIAMREEVAALRERSRLRELRQKLESLRKKLKLPSLEALGLADPKAAADLAALAKADAQIAAFPEMEKRLRCEGVLGKKGHAPGRVDEALRQALVAFQHKHKLYDSGVRADTSLALGHTPLQNDHAALVRVLTERVVSAANILEDGSVNNKEGIPPTYTDEQGAKVPIRNLVEEAINATLAQLELDTPERALAFFQRHPAEDFAWLRVGVKLPAVPAYHSAMMDLSVEIDRGDVFYDPLFDEKGKEANQSRHHFPSLTLRVRWHDQLIPLVRWRTTIGGWRSDLASNGYEYFRYKGSDVGARVWRNVVAGPVWIAPNSTPVRSLIKGKTVNGKSQLVVNYDEVGPGYLSAYGLVAAYNVVPGKDGKPDWDNGVRVHGSSEFLSIRNPNAYSHGCHRLMNHLAVRLFSFVLRHRSVILVGDRSLDFSRQFLWKDDIYEMRLPSRGFYFQLEPTLPVNVLEGNILGKAKKPITIYMPKPGVKYPPGPTPVPPDSPEARAGGGGGD